MAGSRVTVELRGRSRREISRPSSPDDDDDDDDRIHPWTVPSPGDRSTDPSGLSGESGDDSPFEGFDAHDNDIDPDESASAGPVRASSRAAVRRSPSQRPGQPEHRMHRRTPAPRSHRHSVNATESTIELDPTEEFPSYGQAAPHHRTPFSRTPGPVFNSGYAPPPPPPPFNQSNPFAQGQMVPFPGQGGFGGYGHPHQASQNPFTSTAIQPAGSPGFFGHPQPPPNAYDMMPYGAAYGYGYPQAAYYPPVAPPQPPPDPEAEFKKKLEEMEEKLKAAAEKAAEEAKKAAEEKENLRLEALKKEEQIRREQEAKEAAAAAKKEKERQAALEKELEAKRVAEELAFAKAKAEADGRAKAEAEAKAKVEAAAEMAAMRARLEAEGRAKALADELKRKEMEAAAVAEAARREAEIRSKVEAELKAKADAAAAAAEEAKKAEAAIRAKIEEELKKKQEKEAAAAAAAEEAKKKHEEEVKKLAEELAKPKPPGKDDGKKQIRFKDAVGRKFSFPFDICCKWTGMEELIKQAFLHVDVIGPEVQHGHYDLIGPNGEIILPQVWEAMVQPDWAITMVMWPPPEKPKLPPGVHVVNADPRRGGRHMRGGPGHAQIPIRPGPGMQHRGPPPPPPTHMRGDRPPPPQAEFIGVQVVTKEKKKERPKSSGWGAFFTGSTGKSSKSKGTKKG